MNFRQFLGVICLKNLRESVISSPPWGAPLSEPFEEKFNMVDVWLRALNVSFMIVLNKPITDVLELWIVMK